MPEAPGAELLCFWSSSRFERCDVFSRLTSHVRCLTSHVSRLTAPDLRLLRLQWIVLARRRLVTGLCAVAALLPSGLWLLPALTRRLAPTLRDQGDFFYPLKLYTADRLRSG